jgi:hypothetical protein
MRDLHDNELEFVYGAGSGSNCSPRPPSKCSKSSKGSRGKGSKGKSSRGKGSRKYC